jgi:hypothetical protein
MPKKACSNYWHRLPDCRLPLLPFLAIRFRSGIFLT